MVFLAAPAAGAAGFVGTVRTHSISLVRPNGRLLRQLPAGTYEITIRDATGRGNFHLIGPSVDKKTGIGFKGTAHWRLTLNAGVYSYRSDTRPSLMHTFVVH